MKFISYFCFGFAIITLGGAIRSWQEIEIVMYGLIFSGLWYQTGSSFIKQKPWAWWSALLLTTMIAISSLSGVWATIIRPMFYSNMSGVGFGRWLTLAMLCLSLYNISLLLKQSTKQAFKNA